MVKLCIKPRVKCVARFAGRWKIRAGMIRIGRFLKILQMARRASRGEPLKLANRGSLVAILTLHGRVRSE